jgi:hypothetical protein
MLCQSALFLRRSNRPLLQERKQKRGVVSRGVACTSMWSDPSDIEEDHANGEQTQFYLFVSTLKSETGFAVTAVKTEYRYCLSLEINYESPCLQRRKLFYLL